MCSWYPSQSPHSSRCASGGRRDGNPRKQKRFFDRSRSSPAEPLTLEVPNCADLSTAHCALVKLTEKLTCQQHGFRRGDDSLPQMLYSSARPLQFQA